MGTHERRVVWPEDSIFICSQKFHQIFGDLRALHKSPFSGKPTAKIAGRLMTKARRKTRTLASHCLEARPTPAPTPTPRKQHMSTIPDRRRPARCTPGERPALIPLLAKTGTLHERQNKDRLARFRVPTTPRDRPHVHHVGRRRENGAGGGCGSLWCTRSTELRQARVHWSVLHSVPHFHELDPHRHCRRKPLVGRWFRQHAFLHGALRYATALAPCAIDVCCL